MTARIDVVVVGGGPAGLALAIHAARQGLETHVLERHRYPLDKACGEGLLPAGRQALQDLGVQLPPTEATPFQGIRYVQENGTAVEATFSGTAGLGVRRLALVEGLRAQALASGAKVREGAGVRLVTRGSEEVRVATDDEEVRARLLVAADGLSSPIRHSQGLDSPRRGAPRRYGLRQHFRLPGWTSFVEVHFARGVEAYVTPAGDGRVGIAFLFEPDSQAASFETLLGRFPLLAERLRNAVPDSDPRGAGPLWQDARTRVLDRLALLGDAGGYVDALTGEGISLALRGAEALGKLLPDVLGASAARESLLPYDRTCQALFSSYARVARSLLAVARRPKLREQALHFLSRHPRLFQTGVSRATREPTRSNLGPGSKTIRV